MELERILRREVRYQIQSMRLDEVGFRQDMRRAFSILEQDVHSNIGKIRNRRIDEGIDSIIGLVLSGPFIVKMFGKFVNYLDSLAKKYLNKGFGGDVIAKKIIEFADKYHHKILWPFEKVAEKFTSDPEKKEKIAELLLTGVIGAFLAVSLGSVFSAIKSSTLDSNALLQSMKSAIKSKEVVNGIRSSLDDIIPEIVAIAKESGKALFKGKKV
jgi:hypothetical protein